MVKGRGRVARMPQEFADYVDDLKKDTKLSGSTIMREIARLKPIIAKKL